MPIRYRSIPVFLRKCSLWLGAAIKFANFFFVAILLSVASRAIYGQRIPFDGANTTYNTTNLANRHIYETVEKVLSEQECNSLPPVMAY